MSENRRISYSCLVPGCHNKYFKGASPSGQKNKRFHKLKWMEKIKEGTGYILPLEYLSNKHVCEDHFNKRSYNYSRRLMRGAAPTLFALERSDLDTITDLTSKIKAANSKKGIQTHENGLGENKDFDQSK